MDGACESMRTRRVATSLQRPAPLRALTWKYQSPSPGSTVAVAVVPSTVSSGSPPADPSTDHE